MSWLVAHSASKWFRQEADMPVVAHSPLDHLADDDVFLSVKELKSYVAEVEMAKAKQTVDSYNRANKAKEELLAKLRSSAPITKDELRAFLSRVKTAAEAGKNELLIGRFPSDLCTDHGRAINMSEPGWPDTLTGKPRQAYEVWKEKLQPLGYHLKALIVEWPEGMPGDVGMFLSW
jgi:hypothetical protein